MQERDEGWIAAFLLAQGEAEDVLALLQPLLKDAEARGRDESAMHLLLLQSLASYASGRPERAQRLLA
ncbi:MAG TPA: hypothetical protein VKX46_10675, partial [Ktedonobacteraceae bacterium]|nr:hypothetical protein [Ktedonobacteraceae bacterium]